MDAERLPNYGSDYDNDSRFADNDNGKCKVNFTNHTFQFEHQTSGFELFSDPDTDSDTDPELSVTWRQKCQVR